MGCEIPKIKPAGVTFNSITGRYYPVIFKHSPTSGCDTDNSRQCYVTAKLHKDGFLSHEEARAWVSKNDKLCLTAHFFDWCENVAPKIPVWFSVQAITAEGLIIVR